MFLTLLASTFVALVSVNFGGIKEKASKKLIKFIQILFVIEIIGFLLVWLKSLEEGTISKAFTGILKYIYLIFNFFSAIVVSTASTLISIISNFVSSVLSSALSYLSIENPALLGLSLLVLIPVCFGVYITEIRKK